MDTISSYETLYSPSYWSKRYSEDVVVKMHIEFLNSNSENILEKIPSQTEIRYGPGHRQLYKVIGTDLGTEVPILIIIHGGYWQAKEITHRNMIFMSEVFYKQKIKIITIDYDICPDIALNEIIKQIERAIKKCLGYAKTNGTSGIYLLGHSAGAHMLATLFNSFIYNLPSEERTLIKQVFLVSGIYNIVPLTYTTVNEALQLSREDAEKLSPLLMKLNTAEHIVVHIIVAENDTPAFIQQAMDFEEKLKNDGIKSKYHLIKEEDHFSIMEKLSDEDFQLVQIILKSIYNE